jgi:hypothetical protein
MNKYYVHWASRKQGKAYNDFPSRCSLSLKPNGCDLVLHAVYTTGSKEGRDKMKTLYNDVHELMLRFGYKEKGTR